jgi:hypothetical protein
MAELESKARMRQIDIDATEKLYRFRKARDTEQHILDIKSGSSSDKPTVVETMKPAASTNSLDAINQRRRLSKRQALDKTLQILSQNPSVSPSEIAE